MNANEFDQLSIELLNRAIAEGIQQNKMNPLEIIGILELRQHDIIGLMRANAQAAAQAQARKDRPLIVLPRPVA